MTASWTIAIDWNRDGSYTDETSKALSANWFLGFQQPFADVGSDAQLTLIMQNMDKQFTPENPTSVLHGQRVAVIQAAGAMQFLKATETPKDAIFPPALSAA